MAFFKRKPKKIVDLELASYYTIKNLIVDAEHVFFKYGRKNQNYLLTTKEKVLDEVKHSSLGADISEKKGNWYICIPKISDII